MQAHSAPMPHLWRAPRESEVRAFWAITVGVWVLAAWLVVFDGSISGGGGAESTATSTALGTSVGAASGIVRSLVYLHIPAAIGAMCAAGASCVGCLGYLWSRRRAWERVLVVAARVVVVCTLVVLATGMVWGKAEWGVWWTWSPKLTFTLILCALYAGLLLTHAVTPAPRRAMVCAVCGAIAFLDVPLVYLSVRLLPDIHPTSFALSPHMRFTLLVCFAAVLLACLGVIASPLVAWWKHTADAAALHPHAH